MANLQKQKTPWRLVANQELRVEIKEDKCIHLTLRDGQAEIFGSELHTGDTLTLKGQKFAIFSWNGCVVDLEVDEGLLSETIDVAYEADETPQQQYLHMHFILQARRSEAEREGGEGPRVIVVGPTDVGKSSLCKLLLNYAVREGAAPSLVELDIGQGGITAPATICATPVEGPIDIEEGLPTDIPLVYYYGHTTPETNPDLYRYLVERLASLMDRRTQQNAKVRADGMIINTMGWAEGLGYQLLLHSIETLKADVVLVVGQDRLHSQLRNQLRSNKKCEVLKVTRSEGVVTRSTAFRKSTRTLRCREYFYGPQGNLMPHSQTLRFHELKIYKIGGGPRAPTSALPIGAQSVADPLRLSEVRPGRELVQSLVAVSHATTPEELLTTNVAGFLYITAVDVAQTTITYLAPCPGNLPGKYLLAGTLKVSFD